MKRSTCRGATRFAALVLLLTPLACSTRGLTDLSAAWTGDAAVPAVAIAGPDGGAAVTDSAAGAHDQQPVLPDPPPPRAGPDAAALADVGLPIDAAPVTPADGAVDPPHVALLVGRTNLGTADTAIAKRLAGLGLVVELHEDSASAALDLSGVALVFISATTYSPRLETALRELARPIIVSDPFLFETFALTPAPSSTGDLWGISPQQTTLEILAPAHPLAGGLQKQVVVALQPVRLNWGMPGNDALAIASLVDQPDRLALFAFEAGSQLAGLSAPARRVGLFLDLRTANDLGPGGWALFDAAVTWALDR